MINLKKEKKTVIMRFDQKLSSKFIYQCKTDNSDGIK